MNWRMLAALCIFPAVVSAHEGVKHGSAAEATAHKEQTENQTAAKLPAPAALPFNLGGTFELIDHNGVLRTQVDPEGQAQLLFFGYANCPSICAVAMPMMAELTDALAEDGHRVKPVLITVDPKRDTVATMGPALRNIHIDFVGLTGSSDQLAHVYGLFQVSHKKVAEDPEYGAIFAHGSHIYLLDGAGTVMTLLPPILGVDRAKEIIATYLNDPPAGS